MIIFIDDEPAYIEPYTEAFEISGFKVKTIDNVDEAWKEINRNLKELDAVILDIMMPSGRLFKGKDTKGGLRTGLHFVNLMKELDERIAIICLTNADPKSFGKIDHRNSLIFEKKDMDPWQLVEKMSEIKRRKKL